MNQNIKCDVTSCKFNKNCCECGLDSIRVTSGCANCTCCGSFESED